MGTHDWIDVALGLGGIAATVGGGVLVYFLTRRDSLQQTVARHGERLVGLETWAQPQGYKPPER